MPDSTAQHDVVRDQAEKIRASGALGRSRSYVRLLEFLVACTLEGRTPKEHEIATEVFRRGADFDPSQDAMVRVYAHHLRQKLDNFYSGAGKDEPQRITIPKGEYRVVVSAQEPAEQEPAPAARRSLRQPLLAAAAAVLFAAGIALGWWLRPPAAGAPAGSPSAAETVAESAIWRPLLDDPLPTLVVVGDYYIFGELDEAGNVGRLVRNFSINSSDDLENYLMYGADVTERYVDLDLTYLPRSAATALRDVLRVLFTDDKPVRIAAMSELDASDLRTHHILYIGYISALDKLYDFVFESSALAVGETYDELVERESGKSYVSEAGMPADYRNYRDYGLLSTFPGPAGNQFLIVAGMRDAGLMQTAYAVTDPRHVAEIERAAPGPADGKAPPSFELLYEVAGFGRTNLDAVIVHSGPLEPARNWSGRLSPN
ncbi:MAG: hypothetical protein JXB36_11460 [Gammaproteobacteria bacterium]|nr:hypothetical protein [Gammaproteobacteria bacterium]